MKQQVSKPASQRVSPRTRHYRELLVWQRGMRLAKDVYASTAAPPKSEVFGLQGQMRRAAVSIASNIAEGHGRLSDGVFRIFLSQARGPLCELETQLELCRDFGYVGDEQVRVLLEDCNELSRMLNGLIKTLKQKDGTQAADPLTC